MNPSAPAPSIDAAESRPAASLAWHTRSVEALLDELSSSMDGLSVVESARRLALYGRNQLKEPDRISPLTIFLRQFRSLIIWILIVAAGVSGILGELADTLAILAIVVLNACIGFYQELNAEKSIVALRQLTAPQATVRRGGEVTVVPAAEIVPGDLLELQAGDLVAADARVLNAAALSCVESALTGESEAITKHPRTLERDELPLGDRQNMVFMGTSVANGQGCAVVVATGMQTEVGRIAGLMSEVGLDEGTPLQRQLEDFGKVLIWISISVVALLFILGLARGLNFLAIFLTSVSLAVAAVPEGLPAVATVALALGVSRMSRRRALVRRLASVETLGATSVICTDKTGTLTVGEMTVRELYVAGRVFHVTGDGYGPHGEVLFEGKAGEARHAGPLLELANVLIGCNNAHLLVEDGSWKVVGDPTEGALLAAGHKAGGNRQHFEVAFPKHHEIPFDSNRKRRTVVRMAPDGRLRVFINGAPDELLGLCTEIWTDGGVRPITAADRQEIAAKTADMGRRALRVLGSTYRDIAQTSRDQLTAENVERNLIFVGLAGMYDPPRSEAKEAVAQCHAAGIRVVMITGDHPHTAVAIARELNIAKREDTAIAGVELERLSDGELRKRASEVGVFARVSAEHKLRIVRALKANGAVVAMTGDGVNDAPAISGADIGIAMGRSGTEVTKQASDMIITDDNFASIVAAVEEGRGIYDNIRKALQYLVAGNCGELLLMTGCVVGGLPVPLLPIHLLWINLVTDGLPALCLATDPIDPDVMRRRPRRRGERITDEGFLRTLILTGFLTAGVSFAVYLYSLKTGTQEAARTNAFTVLVFAELLRSFGCRSETKPLWRIPLLSNLHLALVAVLSMALQIWSQHNETLGRFLKTSMISVSDCLWLLALSSIPLAVVEVEKVLRAQRRACTRVA